MYLYGSWRAQSCQTDASGQDEMDNVVYQECNGMPIGEVLGLQKDLEFEVGKSNKDARAIQEQRNQRRNKKQGTRFTEQKEEKRKAA